MKKFLKKLGKPFEKLGKGIIEYAPKLGSAVLAGKSEWVDIAMNALNIDDPEKFDLKNLSGEDKLKLKQLEKDHELELLKINLEISKAELQDVQSARQMNVDLDRSNSFFNQHAALGLSLLITAAFCAACYEAFRYTMDMRPNEMLLMLVGNLSGNFTQVVTYWLGSSRGSAEKNSLLTKSTKKDDNE